MVCGERWLLYVCCCSPLRRGIIVRVDDEVLQLDFLLAEFGLCEGTWRRGKGCEREEGFYWVRVSLSSFLLVIEPT